MKRTILLASLAIGLLAGAMSTSALAQPGRQGGPGGFGGFGGFGGGGGLTGVLGREDVRKELGLEEDQIADLEKVGEKIRAAMQEEFGRLRDAGNDGGNPQDRFAAMRETMEKIQKDAEKEVGEVLLPHQMKRAKQLANQLRTRGGVGAGLTDGALADDLGLSEQDREQLREKAQQLEDELRAKLNELRAQAQEKLLAELSSDQRAKYKDLIGEPFEFQNQGPPGFGGPGGAAGGRGGFGGRGGGAAGGAGGAGGRGTRGGRPSAE